MGTVMGNVMSTGLDATRSGVAQVAGAVQAAAPSPDPSPTSTVPDALQVTPGLVGFLATFALALACVLLFLSLTRHLRRASRNAQERGLPLTEPKRRGPAGPVEDDAGRRAAGGEQAGGSGGAPRDTPPDSPADWSDGGRGTSST